jgi:23S rRNA (cytidine1920-2'-O)/16S rRNA (cytidine1409-2'-O)-methyltransferase
MMDPEAEFAVAQPEHPYVSRGGLKLAGALDRWRIDPSGIVCADFGSSTGGFTDCLLQRGALRVYAFDVGKGQLHWRLRNDARVVVREGVNVRGLSAVDLPERVDLVVIDLAFISLVKVISSAHGILKTSGRSWLW